MKLPLAPESRSGRLFDYRDELRFDDPLIGCDQAEPVNDGCRRDGAVPRVTQRPEGGCFQGDFDAQRKPVRSISSRHARHFALNSDAL